MVMFCDCSFRIGWDARGPHVMAYGILRYHQSAKEDSDDDWGIAWKGDKGSRTDGSSDAELLMQYCAIKCVEPCGTQFPAFLQIPSVSQYNQLYDLL